MTKNIFMTLFFIHILSDFYVQNEKMAERKKTQFRWVMLHALQYGICSFFLSVLLIPGAGFMPIFLFILLHTAIDLLIYIVFQNVYRSEGAACASEKNIFAADQLFHVFSLLLISYSMCNLNISSVYQYDLLKILHTFGLSGSTALSWGLKLLLIYKPANLLIVFLLESYKPDPVPLQGAYTIRKSDGDKQAGRFIGVLERLIMTTLISINQYSAVGLVLTAKSIARYNKISENPSFAEYYLLGTLLSTFIAICISLLF